ncbi:translation initiation factor IF-2-like isoform X2 [Gallus gallus]|uniref:translation initiation factor IF-2-like isoform X2 n=1 Tax=Gallus gallus TaxID=9031 RepID=UPI001AE60026|nr:translation initiation factor IF-2-like isoform X2 [Gallus gallus]
MDNFQLQTSYDIAQTNELDVRAARSTHKFKYTRHQTFACLGCRRHVSPWLSRTAGSDTPSPRCPAPPNAPPGRKAPPRPQVRQSPAGSDCASCPSSRSVPKPRARKVPGRAGQRHGRSPYGFAAPRCSEVLSTNEAKRARSAWLRSYPSAGPTPQDESTTRVPSSPAQPPGSPHSPCSSRAGNRYRIRLPYGTNISALRAGAATAHSGPCRAQRRAGQPMAGARGRAAGGAAARPGHTASPSGTRPSLLSSGSARRLLTRIHEARRRLRFIFLLPAGGGGVGRSEGTVSRALGGGLYKAVVSGYLVNDLVLKGKTDPMAKEDSDVHLDAVQHLHLRVLGTLEAHHVCACWLPLLMEDFARMMGEIMLGCKPVIPGHGITWCWNRLPREVVKVFKVRMDGSPGHSILLSDLVGGNPTHDREVGTT